MQSLESKMQEISDRLSKATIEIVSLQEKRMVARMHFQDGVADLSLEKAPDGNDKKDKAPIWRGRWGRVSPRMSAQGGGTLVRRIVPSALPQYTEVSSTTMPNGDVSSLDSVTDTPPSDP